MNRLHSALLGAALALGLLGAASGLAAVLAPPPDTEIGTRVEVDGADLPPVPATPGPPSPSPTHDDEPEEVPQRPVDVDDDDDDDDVGDDD